MTVATITLRPATAADARLLFDWVNSPDALAQKERTRGPIAWPEHAGWLDRLLADRGSALFIVEQADRPIGQVRLERDGDAGVHRVDIYVVPSARRGGVARTALRQALKHVVVDAAVARVKAGNTASRGLFESVGFAEVGREGDIVVYRLEPAKARRG
ncbi:MAG: N-acetyltransferase family protein [Candidatus Eiseniibacteriota bacterium]